MLHALIDKTRGKIYLKNVKARILACCCGLVLLSTVFPAPLRYPLQTESPTQEPTPTPQDIPVRKPKYDYMSTFLSRSTKPLGLKEDLILKKLLKQSRAKWAIRAGARHILD